MKALLLAAGLGTRLRPLTDFLPKPLCLFMGEPMLDLVYKQVKRLRGLVGVAVNTHHLADVIKMHIHTRLSVYADGVRISYEPEILGTGGCLNPLRDWIGSDDLLIYNGDVIADIDLLAFQAAYETRKPSIVAAMTLLPYKPGTTPVFVRDGRVLSIGEGRGEAEQMTFSGVHIIGSRFIDRVPHEGFLNIIDTYKEFLAEGEEILAFEHDSFWADLGSPRDYLKAHQDFWAHPNRERIAWLLGLSTKEFTWDGATQSLYTFRPDEVLDSCRNSFIFGPLNKGSELDGCIVYPLTRLTKREEMKVLTPQTALKIGI